MVGRVRVGSNVRDVDLNQKMPWRLTSQEVMVGLSTASMLFSSAAARPCTLYRGELSSARILLACCFTWCMSPVIVSAPCVIHKLSNEKSMCSFNLPVLLFSTSNRSKSHFFCAEFFSSFAFVATVFGHACCTPSLIGDRSSSACCVLLFRSLLQVDVSTSCLFAQVVVLT